MLNMCCFATQSQCEGSVTEPATRCLDDVAVMLEPVSQNEVVERHNCWRGLKIFFFLTKFLKYFFFIYQKRNFRKSRSTC